MNFTTFFPVYLSFSLFVSLFAIFLVTWLRSSGDKMIERNTVPLTRPRAMVFVHWECEKRQLFCEDVLPTVGISSTMSVAFIAIHGKNPFSRWILFFLFFHRCRLCTQRIFGIYSLRFDTRELLTCYVFESICYFRWMQKTRHYY